MEGGNSLGRGSLTKEVVTNFGGGHSLGGSFTGDGGSLIISK